MKSPEKYEKDDITKYLVRIGAFFFKPFMAGYGKSGVPDIVCCIQGTFFGIEVKREGKTPTKAQELRIAEIQKAGGIAVWGTAAKVIPEIETWLASKVR